MNKKIESNEKHEAGKGMNQRTRIETNDQHEKNDKHE